MQQVRVRRQDRLRIVAEAGGHGMQRHRRIGRERQRGGGVAQDVQGADREPRCLAVPAEPLREALRVDRGAELVAEHQV